MNFDVKTEKLSEGQYVISSRVRSICTRPEFRAAAARGHRAGGRDVIVDLSNTTFIDLDDARRARRWREEVADERGSSHSSAATETSRRSSRSPASTASLRFTRRSRLPSARDLPPRCSCAAGRRLRGPDRRSPRPAAARPASPRPAPATRPGQGALQGKCGQCHTLADAGTRGAIGPNLDDAFLQSRADGLEHLTVQSVVSDQIAYPVEHPTTGARAEPAEHRHRRRMQTRSPLYVASRGGRCPFVPSAGSPGSRR
jgi:hypothetical protein